MDINQLLEFVQGNREQGVGADTPLHPGVDADMPVSPSHFQSNGPRVPSNVDTALPRPPMPRDPDSRADVWRNLLTDFVWSFGKGVEGRSKGRKGAGIGEAILGPWTLEQENRKQQLLQQTEMLKVAQEERTKVASQEAMNKIQQAQAELPAKLQQILASTRQSNAAADANVARVPQIEAQTANTQATTQNTLADVAQKQLVKVGKEVYKLSDLIEPGATNVKPINAGDEGLTITITPQMANNIGQPQLAGQVVSAKVGKDIVGMVSSSIRQVPTAGGVLQQNLTTGQTTNLGAPAGVATQLARPVDIINPATGLPVVSSVGNAIATGATPGHLSDVQKLTGQAASFGNFHSNANRVRELLPAIDQPGATVKIAAAMAQPEGTIRAWAQGQLATANLTNDQYDLINAIATMREDIFNMRQFFGNSPIRSDNQVSLMLQQLPSIADLSTGNSEQVARKIDNFERSIHAIESKYGPLMSIIKNPQMQPGPANNAPVGSGGGAAKSQAENDAENAKKPDYVMKNGRMVINPDKVR